MRTAFDLDLNVDLVLSAGPILVENLALVVYEGPVAVGGADMPVPPAVTESVAADVEMLVVVIHEGPVGGDGAVTDVVVLATMDGKHFEAGQIVRAGMGVLH